MQLFSSNDPNSPRSALEPFLQRHSPHFHFGEHESALLERISDLSHRRETGAHIRFQSGETTQPWIVASGWACYARTLQSGARQIFGLILPGDTIGLTGGPFAQPGSEIVALTALILLDASRIKKALSESSDKYTNIRNVCEVEQGLHEARLLDQVVRLGQLTSVQRTAHLILELHHRMDRAGLVNEGRFNIPLTQVQFGEMLGLSLVHVNRTLQALRHQGLLVLNAGFAAIPNIGLLEAVATAQPR